MAFQKRACFLEFLKDGVVGQHRRLTLWAGFS